MLGCLTRLRRKGRETLDQVVLDRPNLDPQVHRHISEPVGIIQVPAKLQTLEQCLLLLLALRVAYAAKGNRSTWCEACLGEIMDPDKSIKMPSSSIFLPYSVSIEGISPRCPDDLGFFLYFF